MTFFHGATTVWFLLVEGERKIEAGAATLRMRGTQKTPDFARFIRLLALSRVRRSPTPGYANALKTRQKRSMWVVL